MSDTAAHSPQERLQHLADDTERTNRLIRRVLGVATAAIALSAAIFFGATFAHQDSILNHQNTVLECQAGAYRAVITDLNQRTVAAQKNTPLADYPVVALPPSC